MHRSHLIALVVALAAVLAGLALWLGEDVAPPVPRESPPGDGAAAAAAGPAAGAQVPDRAVAGAQREAVSARGGLLADPEVRAGLCGFRGRVVDHRLEPVADCGVRIYRGGFDSILPSSGDLFVDQTGFAPDYVAGETRTSADGTWRIDGVWPRGLYVLQGGRDTAAPTMKLLTRTPAPGEIIDLGDLVLPDAGVLVGRVVDDDGEPVPGAWVRAADLPAVLLTLLPAERFDPNGAILVREPSFPVRVLELPAWVARVVDELPFPSARTGTDGSFRLVGVIPGSNLLATVMPEFLSDVRPSVLVRAGQERDVGTIRLRRGEELVGRVVDGRGQPVVAAEVLAGGTLTAVPFDFARRLGVTDEEGRFHGTGFAPGRVTVAARRGKGQAWVLSEPQPLAGEVVVVMPSAFAVTVNVTATGGGKVTAPRFRLLPGKRAAGAAELHLLGLSHAIDLAGRIRQLDEHSFRIEDLASGPYMLAADAPGHAMASAAFELNGADAAVALELGQPRSFRVRVVNSDQQPVRNATVFAEAQGARGVSMPLRCGLTDADGRLVVHQFEADSLKVSAEHPRFGTVHGEARLDAELALVMQVPGALHGMVKDHGLPPAPGKYTIMVEFRRPKGPSGPLASVPHFATPAADGRYEVQALQPGTYLVQVVRALDALGTPGSVMELTQQAYLTSSLPAMQVEIGSGQAFRLDLEVAPKPITGPKGALTGSVMIDGRLGVGCVLSASSAGRNFSAQVDARGRFELPELPAGEVWLQLVGTDSGVLIGRGDSMWSTNIDLQPDETRELTIELFTASLAGACSLADGAPVPGITVVAQGRLKSGGGASQTWMSTITDAAGRFRLDRVPEGTWRLQVRGKHNGRALRGHRDGIEVIGGVPVDGLHIELVEPPVVAGHVDVRGLAALKVRFTRLMFYRLSDHAAAGAQGTYADMAHPDPGNGAFRVESLAPGRYRMQLAAVQHAGESAFECGIVEVPARGVTDLVVVPILK